MGNPLWAPWRMEYILAPKDEARACIFCDVEQASDSARRERLIVCTTEHAYVVMNRYPFSAGHLLIVPYAHKSSLDELDEQEHDALFRLVRDASTRLTRALKAEGLNVGLNLGAVAGAGIAAHLHVHIVPRWSGDTNFMPVLAETRVIPQALEKTRDHLEPFFADLAAPPAATAGARADSGAPSIEPPESAR